MNINRYILLMSLLRKFKPEKKLGNRTSFLSFSVPLVVSLFFSTTFLFRKASKKMKQTKTEYKQSNLSAPVSTGGLTLTRLGYTFPSHVAGNKFFQEFIAGFKASGVECFTELQCSMLDELIHSRAFQVTSPDVSCGSGKTSLTVAATIGLFQEHDKIIFVNKPGRGESSLTKELKQLVEKFSGGPTAMRVSTVLNDVEAVDDVPQSDVIITNCIALGSVLLAVAQDSEQQQQHLAASGAAQKVFLIFDEAHKIFNHDGLTKMAAWTLEQERSRGSGSGSGEEAVARPALAYVCSALTGLHPSSTHFTTIPVFLSAVGDFSTSKLQKKEGAERPLSSSEVVEMCIGQWLKTPVTKLVNSGNNSERNYNTIFKIHREGAIQIGGVDAYGYAMVYEAMFKIAFNRLIKGRMLFIVRRQQVETFSSLLDEKIKESGSFFSYTADRDYWNATNEDTYQPLYNIVIVREDELDDLEGVNIEGLRAVYLFSLGRTKNLYQKMQGLGRVGRLGQEASYCFVMIDCATKKNGAIEAESSPFLVEALSSNGTCRPHVIEVKGAKALDVPSNIPTYHPSLEPPTPLQLQKLQRMMQTANRPQVCKFMRYSPQSRCYECPSLQKGYRCAWYHPRPADFAPQSTSLRCCTLNTTYCKKGVFREAPCRCMRSLVPIAPLAPGAAAWTAGHPAPASVLSASFPKLGDSPTVLPLVPTASATATATAVVTAEAVLSKRNPRLDRPVCRFAAMDMYKCKTRRQGQLCFFRHPEEAEDCVTDEEYLEALQLSIANLNKTKAKYGQKPLVFSRDLYTKYNYPGRFKSCLAKPQGRVKAVHRVCAPAPPVPEPVQSLAEVLASEAAVESFLSTPSPLFTALQSAYAKKSAPASPRRCLLLSPPSKRTTDDEAEAASQVLSAPPGGHAAEGGSVDDGFTDVGSSSQGCVRQSKPQGAAAVSCSVNKQAKKVNYFQLLSPADDDDEEEEDEMVALLQQQKEQEKQKEKEEEEAKAIKEAEEKELMRVEEEKRRAEAVAVLAAAAAAARALSASREAAAKAIVASGLAGSDVVNHLRGQGAEGSATATTAAALASAILADQPASALSYHLFTDEKFGLGLKHLLLLPSTDAAQITAQVDLLEAVEMYCHAQNFIKVDMKSGKKYVIDVLFLLLYALDLVEEEAFFAWHEGGGEEGERVAAREEVRLRAVLQTTEFFSWLLQDQGEEEDEEEEGDVVTDYGSHYHHHHQQPTLPTSSPQEPELDPEPERELSKAERKALKQLRRQEKVADRGDGAGSKLSHRHLSSSSSLHSSAAQ
jgi:hypothetical protein